MAHETTAVQDQILDAIRTTQEAAITVCRTWTQTFASVTPRMIEVFAVPRVDSFNGFAEKVWNTQRDFFVTMGEVAGGIIPETAKRSAAAADTARTAAKS
jgi:hypothetical protein